MPQPNDERERVRVNIAGTQITLSGPETIMIVGLLSAIGLLIFLDIRYAEISRATIAEQVLQHQARMVEQEERSRQLMATQQEVVYRQYQLLFNELKIQTWLMSLPEWKRPQLVDPEKLEENLRQHLEKTPGMPPPLLDSDPPPKPRGDGMDP